MSEVLPEGTRVKVTNGEMGDKVYNGYEGVIVRERNDSTPSQRTYDVRFATAPYDKPHLRWFSEREFEVVNTETLEAKRDRLERELEKVQLQIEGRDSAENLPNGTMVIARNRERGQSVDASTAFHKADGKWSYLDALGGYGVSYTSSDVGNDFVQSFMIDKNKYDTQVIKPEGN